MRIALGLQYDGSGYFGWQSQVDLNTVQDTLQSAISLFVGDSAVEPEAIKVITAGRTDTGVHALGQVVHFDTKVERDPWSWVRGVNAFLPESVVVNWAKPVVDQFSARFSAYERAYIYALHAGPCRSPMAASRAGYFMMPADTWFDVEAMQAASECLVGKHDFSSFRSSECQSKTPVKTLYAIEIVSMQPWLYFKIRGNAFLHHMVRNLVGSFLMVGTGKRPSGWIAEVLAAKDRRVGAPTFAPHGLYLAKISYPPEFAIPEPWLSNSWLPLSLLQD